MSTPSTIPLFGRSWNLLVLSAPTQGSQTLLQISANSFEPEALRVTFDIRMTTNLSAYWEAEISIYNLDPKTIGLITQGAEVSLSAGYQAEGAPTEIWRGTVYQPIFERVGGVDFVLALHCILGLDEIANSFLNCPVGPVQTQWEIIQTAAKSAGINIAHLDDQAAFVGQKLPRAKTIFGSVNKFIQQITSQNNMVSFYSQSGLNIGKPKGASTAADIIYAPPLAKGQQPASNEASLTRSLIGSPQQTDQGVNLRVLLDPRLQIRLPLMQVQISQAIIRQQQIEVGATPPLPLSQDGIYLVAGIRHVGDTCGNEFYSEILGAVSVDGALSLLGGSPNAQVT